MSVVHRAASNDTFKAALAERSVRSYKNLIYKILTSKLSHRWLEYLPAVTKLINSRYHRVIGCAPRDVNDSNILQVWQHIQQVRAREDAKFLRKKEQADISVGDFVRLAKNKHFMDKGFLPQWTDEVFKVTRNVKRKPQIYNIVDENGEEVQGAFYRPELQKVAKNKDTLFRIDKILATRKRGGITQVLVEWKGGNKKNKRSWIKESDIVDGDESK